MRQSWDSYEKAAEKGPLSLGIKIVIGIFLLSMVIGALGYVGGWFTETAQVVKEEFGPREALRKYEWFKDASASLDKKQADIRVYQSRVSQLEEDYAGVPRKDWPRSDREQLSIWRTEVAGVRASFNTLAAEYNAQMAKFNWAFANAGSLPEGATQPLPREYKTYEE